MRRSVARAQARARHGSIPAFMDSVVATVPAPAPVRVGAARRSRQRIVEVSTYPLYPRQGGGPLRGWHLAEAITHDGDTDVTVISLTTDPAQAGHHELAPGLTEICLALQPDQLDRETRLRLVTGNVALTDIAAGLMWAGIDGLADTLRRELDGATAAVLVQPYLIDAVRTVADGLPIICDEHNDELVLKRSIIPDNVAGRWLLDHIDTIERSAVESASLVTATTDRDLDTLGARYSIDAPTAVVPNGVDTTEIEFVVGGDRRRRRLALATDLGLDPGRPAALFIGSGHGPNIDAGRAIVNVAHHLPDVDFLLAGRHSGLLGITHLPANVRLLGVVDDELHDLLLAACDLALNPMNAGSGSNLKLLTYLAAGLPVVSTEVGARGIDSAAAGVQITGMNDIENGIIRLLGVDHTERSLAGRHYVEEHCDWRAIGRRFAALTAEHISS
jgi:glycosyltransferase involved in cell wall biosynthesis